MIRGIRIASLSVFYVTGLWKGSCNTFHIDRQAGICSRAQLSAGYGSVTLIRPHQMRTGCSHIEGGML